MSTTQPEQTAQERRWADMLSGFFAAAALFFSLIALARKPMPVSVAAILLALLAAGMSSRHQRLAATALAVAGLSFVAGISIAILTGNPLW